MPSLGSLFYTMGIRDYTDADLKKINAKLKNLGFDITLTPKILKDLTQAAVPKGIKIELDPSIKSDALAKAVEGKVMRMAVTPLMTGFREAITRATRENPAIAEVSVSETRLRTFVQNVLNKQGFMLNISTVNDNYSKAIQARLNGTTYKVKIHADAKEITRSVQASLMQVQSRYFGLKVSRDVLYRSIDEALGTKRFNINIAVQQDQARKAVQDALLRAQVMGKEQTLNYQRLQTGELKAAQAELVRLKAAQLGAADAARIHASASVNLGGALGSNIKIAGELGSAMASLYSVQAAKQFLSQVVEIGGELEHQKIAMDTIFGDKGKTNELFGQIKGLARQSPFGVMELSKSVKALSAYGVEYNEIYDTAKRLADISAATSVDINRLILAFGKTKSRGFLDGLEAKQFAYANIPIYEMVRKKLEELEGQAVTTAEVMARMKKREIGFDIVKDVLWDITDEGGKFYNMQEALAGSVKTSWKLVRDNIELMFGEIAEGAVGSSLKSLAEILQGLTRNWRELGAVLATGAGAFGVYKLAVLASNTMMGKAATANLTQRASQAKLNASLAKTAMTYRGLSAEENRQVIVKNALQKATSKNIFATNALTSSEIKALVTERALTRDSAARLIAMGKITPMQARYLINQKLITVADMRAAAMARRHGLSINLLGKEVTIASFRFKMLATSVLASAKALLSMVVNPATLVMAAIGAIAYAWESHNTQMEKAKEIGDNIFTKATEGANNLKQTLKDIKPSTGLSEHELTQGIEQMEQAIKDYSPRPLQDINDTLVAQDGHVLTLAERYDALRKKVEGVAEAYETMGRAEKGGADVGSMVSDSIKSTSSWWLDDTVLENAKDYTNALKRRSDAIREATMNNARSVKKAVDAAIKADAQFAKVASGMKNTAAMFNELATHPEKYTAAYERSEVSAAINIAGVGAKNRGIAEDRERFLSDVQDQIKTITANIRMTWDKEIKDLDDSQKDALAISLKNMLDQAEGVSEDVKMEWALLLEKAFGVTIIEDKIGPALKGNFVSIVSSATDAAKVAVIDKWKNEGWDALSEVEKEIVNRLMDDAKFRTMTQLGKTADEMQAYLTDHPLSQIIQLSYEGMQASALQREIWNDTLAQRLSDEIPMPALDAFNLTDSAKQARTWYNSWTRGASGYKEMQSRYESARKEIADEIEAATNASEEWKQAKKDELAAMDALAADMKLTQPKEKGGKDGGKSTKDEFAESLKQRFKDIKDAWSEFQKWSKTEGREAAATRIGESGLFSTLSADQIPKTIEDYRALVKGLEDELRKAGVKGTAREGLLNDLLKQLLDIDKTLIDEQLQLALDKVSKEAERQLADWNLFDKIRKATGNQDLAMSIAFSMNVKGETDYPSMIKQQLQKTVDAAENALSKAIPKEGESPYEVQGYNYEKLKELYDARETDKGMQAWMAVPEEIRKAWEKANGDILKYFDQQRESVANILNEYQTLQDKIDAINAKRNLALETINAKNEQGEYILSDEERAKRSSVVNTQADYDIFTQSNDYLRFFNDIYGLTMDEANRIGDLIQLNLNRKLQDGLITIYDYEQQMEKVRKQLEALRNVKSDAMTFLTGGLKGLNQKKLQKAEGELANNTDYQKALKEQIAAQNALNKAQEEGNEEDIEAAEAQLALANQSVQAFTKIRDAIIADQEKMQNVLDVANIAANIAGGMADAFNSIRDMADAFGVDTDSGAWNDIAAMMDTLTAVTGGVQKVVQSAMSGDIGGILSGAVSTITTPFTIWAKLHDKKLQKLIDRSKEAAQIMQNQYDILEKRMANFLGNAANMKVEGYSGDGGAYGKQLELMKGQLGELEKQRQLEMDKKKSDDSVVEDYNKQIEEMKISIQDFAIEAANAVYGIDLNGWAEQLGDALVDAFAAGEDAAEAFDNTVSDIMRSLVSKMISQDLIAPMFDDVRDYLFGKNGVYANAADGGDFTLSEKDAIGLAEKLKGMQSVVENAKAIYDQINEATGGMLDDTEAKSGLSAGIQGVTEDTADLLASYLNSIRADVSVQTHDLWPRLLDTMLPQMTVIAQSQLDYQRQIAENTMRNAVAAEAIVKSNEEINRLLARVTQGRARFYIK